MDLNRHGLLFEEQSDSIDVSHLLAYSGTTLTLLLLHHKIII